MVKKILGICLAVFSGTLLVGCNKASDMVYPMSTASLVLSFPVPQKDQAPSKVKNVIGKMSTAASSSVSLTTGTFEYRITSGSDVFSGSVSVNLSGQSLGTVSVPLPHNGTWFVSAEWFDFGTSPRFIGADQVDVEGITNFTLNMGDVTQYGCSYDYMDDPNYYCGAYYGDIFTFDSATAAFSNSGGAGDIQVKYDTNSGTEYITAASGSNAKFAYLGTGDWVNYTYIPAGTTYFNDTEQAKAAVAGPPAASMVLYDVYVVQLSSTSHVWLQIPSSPYYCGGPGAEVYLSYRVNNQGLSYMKFDETSYDKANCVNLNFYSGGT